MVEDCMDCRRLWQDYAEATRNHLRVENKLKTAVLKHDHDVVTSLTGHCETAAEARRVARDAVRRHEVDAHPSAAGKDEAAAV
jgi:hypothetical protein